MNNEKLIPRYGGYRKLRSFKTAQWVYDATVVFCERFVNKFSRTRDQMVQAARSGVQNIAEGSMASATSKKTELKLTGVARASLEELLLDYEDFLRQRGLEPWHPDSPRALVVRRSLLTDRSDRPDGSDPSDKSESGRSERSAPSEWSSLSDPKKVGQLTPEDAANTLICVINQASYLLRRQLQYLEKQFSNQGGFTEKLYRFRNNHRS